MNASSQSGIWEETLLPGITMTCNTNLNQISVVNEHGIRAAYNFPEGITIGNIETIKHSILKTHYTKKFKSKRP